MEIGRSIVLLCALVACPIAYIALLNRMRRNGISRPPVVPYFFQFGTLGGWFLAMALSPGGLAAICAIFLWTFGLISVLTSSIYLITQPERSIYHRVAIWGGLFIYPALIGFGFILAFLSSL